LATAVLVELAMLQGLRHILEMIRFSHTVFALPFALLAAVMAWTAEPPIDFRWRDVMGIVVCMVAARSAAMAFNRLADRRLDAQNPRTAMRQLPAGVLSPRSVILFTLASSAVFVAATLLFFPNRLPLQLAIPVLAFLLAYSYTKRFTSLAHFWLGASLLLAPVCAWIALRGVVLVQNPLDILPAVWLGMAVLFWVAGFDMIYACQDVEFDRQAKLRSIPAAIGVAWSLRLAAGCHLIMILMLLSLPYVSGWGGPVLGLGAVYLVGVVLVAALLVYEHWLVRPTDLTRVNVAFFHVNAIVSMGLFLIGVVDLTLI
jgi:4-hydroxybenzoate polyprenyltransferase